MERARILTCRDCTLEIHSEHDLEGCTHVVQRCIREGVEFIEVCACTRTPFPLKAGNVLKLKDPSH
jgi:hypothetical protein